MSPELALIQSDADSRHAELLASVGAQRQVRRHRHPRRGSATPLVGRARRWFVTGWTKVASAPLRPAS